MKSPGIAASSLFRLRVSVPTVSHSWAFSSVMPTLPPAWSSNTRQTVLEYLLGSDWATHQGGHRKKKKNNQPVLWFQFSPSSLLQVQANIGILFMSRNWASHNPPVNLTDSSISQVGLASLCQTPELGCPKCGLNNSLSRGGLHFYNLPFPPSLLPGAQSWPDHISFFSIQFHMDLSYNLCCTEVFLLVSS